jgi:signal recognition particle receptor subunit beta
MVFFNASTRELTAKIVYYGPGLGGKTTNLKVLHQRLEPGTAGELVQLSTENDRTIYFDLMPVELGDIKGYRIRFQLTTVPGQTAFNETRRVVLKDADGVVFVADSQWTLLPKNMESWQSLGENLAANSLALETMPVVIQFNKRDLPDILSVEAMQEALGFSAYPHVEAIASEGRGVTETFKLISKLTFLDLLRRLQGRPTPDAVTRLDVGRPAPAPAAPELAGADREEQGERRRPLTLVRPLDRPAEEEALTDEPFPEADSPLETGTSAATALLEERVRTLEAEIEAAVRSEELHRLRTRVDEIEARLSETGERLAAEVASVALAGEERVRSVEQHLEAEVGHLRERTDRLEEQVAALGRDIEQIQRALSEAAEPRRESEDLKLQLAPLLEEQVRRETDENWSTEIERLRQALAESLEDLSERVRRAVRG